MADQTPDPWKNVKQYRGDLPDEDVLDVDVYLTTDVDRARDAERQQHQQTIQQQAAQIATLTQALEQAIADTRSDAQLSKNPIRAELMNVAHRFADVLRASRPTEGGELTMSERETALQEIRLAIIRRDYDTHELMAKLVSMVAALPPGDAPQTCEWREDRHGYAGPGCHGGIRSFSRIERERWTVCPYCAGRLITEVTR